MIPFIVTGTQGREFSVEAELHRLPLFRQLEAVRQSLRTLLPLYDDEDRELSTRSAVPDSTILAVVQSRVRRSLLKRLDASPDMVVCRITYLQSP